MRAWPPAIASAMGKDVKTISGLLRHAKSSTTLDLYSQAMHARWERGKGDGVQSPSPLGPAFTFPGWSWSIDDNASSGRGSLDLCDWRPQADGIVAGRPEFEIEHSFVGFAVGRNGIGFVDGEQA